MEWSEAWVASRLPIWRMFETEVAFWADPRARVATTKANEASVATITMTTSNSVRVKPVGCFFRERIWVSSNVGFFSDQAGEDAVAD